MSEDKAYELKIWLRYGCVLLWQIHFAAILVVQEQVECVCADVALHLFGTPFKTLKRER